MCFAGGNKIENVLYRFSIYSRLLFPYPQSAEGGGGRRHPTFRREHLQSRIAINIVDGAQGQGIPIPDRTL